MNQHQNVTRRGTILILVLVCMGVATSIVLATVQSSVRQRRQMRQELKMEQTQWLLEAGIRRGISRWDDEVAYEGETWAVTPALAKYPNATVKIEVIRDISTGESVQLLVTARCGSSDDETQTIQRSRKLIMLNPNTKRDQ